MNKTMTIAERLDQAKEIYQLLFENKGQNASDGSSVEHYLMKIIGSLSEADKANEQGLDCNAIIIQSEDKKDIKTRFITYNSLTPKFNKIYFERFILNTWQDKLADVYIGLVGLAMHYFAENGGVSMYDVFLDKDFTLRQLDVDEDLSFSERCFDLVKALGNATINDIFSINAMNLAFELQQLFPAFDLDWHVAEKMKYLKAIKN